jgi:hypothetical protein
VGKNQFLEIKEFSQEYAKLDRRPYRLGGAERKTPAVARQSEPSPAKSR